MMMLRFDLNIKAGVLAALVSLGGTTWGAGVSGDIEHLQYWVKIVKQHPLEMVRKCAAKMLGSMGDKRALGGLIEALKDAASPVRQEAAASLGVLVDPRAVPALEEVFDRDPDPAVRKKAQIALSQIQKRKEYDKSKKGDSI